MKSLNRKFFDFKKSSFRYYGFPVATNVFLFVRLWVKVLASQEWVQAEITVAIQFRVNPIGHFNLALPITIDTKQVKQQKYREKRYPIKSFTVPSKTYNKVSIQQYYIVETTTFPLKSPLPPCALHWHPK